MKRNQIDIITMGCSKNLVDSEHLMKQFEANGYHCVHDSKRPDGEIAVINTCGFIESAKEESINTILEFVHAKNEGRLKRLYVMGCLSQRYKDELEKEIPEVDKFYGKFNYKQFQWELIGICVMQSYPLDSLDIGHITDKVSNMPLPVNINSIVSKFLCNDLKLLNTIIHKLSYFL